MQSTLLQIDKSDARLGMFIHGFGTQWFNSPFKSHQFKLTSPADLKILQESNVRTLIIDLSKGVGLQRAAPPQQVPHADPVTQQIAATLTQTTAVVQSIFADAVAGRGIQVRQLDGVVAVVNELMSVRPTTVLSLNKLKLKDETSFQHSISVCALAGHFSRYLKVDRELERSICIASLLHDIGKLRIPGSLLKKTEALTDEETAIMRTHPQLGYDLLAREADLPEIVGDICLHHHERLDGTGYPYSLAGEEIALPIRIVTICDVYDAMTTVRPYKTGWPPETAKAHMTGSQGHFDPELLAVFFESVGLQRPGAGTNPMPPRAIFPHS